MNIFFKQRYRYKTIQSIDEVIETINSFLDTKWHEHSPNITGVLKDKYNFTLWHKWSMIWIQWIERNPAYLSGKLISDGDKTIINVALRPNSVFVILFYFFIGMFIWELGGFESFIQGPKEFNLLLFSLFAIIMLAIIRLYTTGLRKRFERLMGLELIN